MREYGQIQCSFWQSARAEGWSSEATQLGAYLLTSPHSNGIGCYSLPDGYIAADLGWDEKQIRKGFEELSRNGFADRFGTVVFLPKFMRWNPIANGNVAKARQGEWEALPKGEAKLRCAKVLLEFGNHWSDGFRTVLETVSEGYTEQNPTQPNPEPTQPKARERAQPFDPISIDLPEWLPADRWRGWVEFRRERKAPLTPSSVKQQLADLGEWRKAGHDPLEIIATSIRGGYQGLFEPKGKPNGGKVSQFPVAPEPVQRIPANPYGEPS